MSDDELERLDRQLQGLLASYGGLEKIQTRHDERIDRAAAERREIREEIRQLRDDLLAAIRRSEERSRELVAAVSESCDDSADEWKDWVKRYDARREHDRDREDRSRISNRTLAIGVVAAVIAACGVVVALIAFIAGGG